MQSSAPTYDLPGITASQPSNVDPLADQRREPHVGCAQCFALRRLDLRLLPPPAFDQPEMTDTLERLTAALSDRYRPERELGAGGMATVYLAHDLRHDREVAIKVLHPDLGAALGGDRFLGEIRTTARLQHPHILPLLDSGEAGGLLFYVMPYIRGETLRDRLERETQLPVADALRIAGEIAGALTEAHSQGIVHRDIKPENILLSGAHALVADFGIALAVQQAGGARMTQTGLSLGTLQYMAPEQAMGDKHVDHRADQYALAAVTYEMLTGEPPHTGTNAQAIVAKLLTEQVRSATVLRPSVPAHVDAALRAALQKLPADRFADVAAFLAALRDGRTTDRLAFAFQLPITSGFGGDIALNAVALGERGDEPFSRRTHRGTFRRRSSNQLITTTFGVAPGR